MGASSQYGILKYWFRGGTWDGMDRPTSPGTQAYGFNADYLFSPTSAAALSFSISTTTVAASVADPVQATVICASSVSAVMKIDGASSQYSVLKYWSYGETFDGMARTTSTGGGLYGMLTDYLFSRTSAAALSFSASTTTSTAGVADSAQATIACASSVSAVMMIGGANEYPQLPPGSPPAALKFWSYGKTFQALGNHASYKFREQALWYYGLPEPELFQMLPFVTDRKIIASGPKRKRSAIGFPGSVKIISAGTSVRNN